MKNFPHQFSNIEKLTEALRVCSEVLERRADVASDSVLGEALARAGVYTFRGAGDVEQLLEQERLKPRSSRGTETAAREMRRFLWLSGFIFHSADDGYVITSKGEELLKADTPTVRQALWREAMLDLALEGAQGQVSHPYRILLRLVYDNPGIETFKLMLAFEAQTDSAAEYDRISGYLDLSFRDLINHLGVGESAAKNAVKILPSIAEQVGDISRAHRQSWPAVRMEVAEDGYEHVTERESRRKTSPRRGRRVSRRVAAEAIATAPQFADTAAANVDLTSAIELRRRRTELHQIVVRELAIQLDRADFILYEDPFDCLGLKEDLAILIEVKTLDGSPSDERKQSERALGQIRGYTYFDLPENVPDAEPLQVIAFSQKPTDEIIQFLNSNGILVLWRNAQNDWELSGIDGDVIAFEPNGLA